MKKLSQILRQVTRMNHFENRRICSSFLVSSPPPPPFIFSVCALLLSAALVACGGGGGGGGGTPPGPEDNSGDLSGDPSGDSQTPAAIPSVPAVAQTDAVGPSVRFFLDGTTDAAYYRVYISATDSTSDLGDARFSRVQMQEGGYISIDQTTDFGTGYYWIEACNSQDKCSDLSISMEATTREQALGTPADFTLFPGGSNGQMIVSWSPGDDPNNDRSYYWLYRSDRSDDLRPQADGSRLDSGDRNGLVNPPVGTWYYWVRACDSTDNCSEYSAVSEQIRISPDKPDQPVLEADATGQRITLRWEPIEGANYYHVYRNNTSDDVTADKQLTQDEGWTQTSYVIEEEDRGIWSYWVKACVDQSNCSELSEPKTVTSRIQDLPAPENLQVDVTRDNRVRLSWDGTTEASYYEIYRSDNTDDSGVGSEVARDDSLSTTERNYYELTAGLWYYRVRACRAENCSGFSSFSVVAAVKPVAPSGLSASATQRRVSLSWRSVSGADYYQIYRRDATAANNAIRDPRDTTSDLSYIIEQETEGTWDYWVKACNNDTGCSDFSISDRAQSTRQVLAVPGDLDATVNTANNVTVSWSQITDATNYEVYRYSSADGSDESRLDTNFLATNSYNYVEDTPGIWYYRVKACKDDNCSEFSEYSEPLTIAPEAPTELRVASDGVREAHGQRVDLSWDTVSDSAYHRLYRSATNTVDSSSDASWKAVAGLSASTDRVRTAGRWYYRIKACIGEDNCSDFSPFSAVVIVVPDAPAGLAADVTGDGQQVELSWQATQGVDFYQLYRVGGDFSDPQQIDTTLRSQINYTDMLPDGGVWSYQVKACISEGSAVRCSGFSSPVEVAVVPNVPVKLSARVEADDQTVVLSWDKVGEADYYAMYRSDSSDDIIQARRLGIWALQTATSRISYTIEENMGRFYYWVKACIGTEATTDAVDRHRCSDYSESSGEVVSGLVAPRLISVGASALRVTLAWEAIPAATFYQIFKSTSSDDTTAQPLDTGTTTIDTPPYSFEETAVGTYYYWVKACRADDCSALSNSKAAETTEGRLDPPSFATDVRTPSGIDVDLSWDAVTDATSYKIYSSASDSTADIDENDDLKGITDSLSFRVRNEPAGERYYWLKACKGSNCSLFSASQEVNVLAAPLWQSAIFSVSGVDLSWDSADNAQSYAIYRSDMSGDASPDFIAVVDASPTSNNPAQAGVYYYQLRACLGNVDDIDNSGDISDSDCSAYSAQERAIVPPQAPSFSYTGTVYRGSRVDLTWDRVEVAGSSVTYSVYRSDQQTGSQKTPMKSGLTTNRYDGTADAGTWYYWLTACIEEFYCSGFSSPPLEVVVLNAPDSDDFSLIHGEATDTTGTRVKTVTLNWDFVTGADYYRIYSDDVTDDIDGRDQQSFTPSASDTSGSQTFTVSVGVRYYWIKACVGSSNDPDDSRCSDYSDHKSIEVPPLKPRFSPSGSIQSGKTVSLSWLRVADDTSYAIYRTTDSTTPEDTDGELDATSDTSYTDKSTSPGLYWYWLKACKTSLNLCSDYSNPLQIQVLAAPDLTEDSSSGQTVLRWTDRNEPSADSYVVFRQQGSSASAHHLVNRGSSLSYTPRDSGQWLYWVRACIGGTRLDTADDNNCSELSDIVGTVTAPPPTEFNFLFPADGSYSGRRINLSWSDVIQATDYDIYRRKDSSDDSTLTVGEHRISTGVAETSIAPYTTAGRWYYWVRACITAGGKRACSDYSPAREVKVLAPPVVELSSDPSADLIWDTVEGAEVYFVYWSDTAGSDITLARGQQRESSGSILYSATDVGQWYYQVRACIAETTSVNANDSRCSAFSNSIQFTVAPPVPVFNTPASLSGMQVDLSWDSLGTGVTYTIYQTSSSGRNNLSENNSQGSTPATSFSHRNATDVHGTRYYWLKACLTADDNVCSDYSEPLQIEILSPPQNFEASYINEDPSVDTGWDPVQHALSYHIYADDGTAAEMHRGWLFSVPATDTSGSRYSYTYRDTVSGHWKYKVRACTTGVDQSPNDSNCSDFSNIETVLVPPPVAQFTLSGPITSGKRVFLSWDDYSGSSVVYALYRSRTASAEPTFLREKGEIRSTTSTFHDSTNDGQWFYRVRRSQSTISSRPSDPLEVVILAPPTLTLESTDGGATRSLSWNKAQTADDTPDITTHIYRNTSADATGDSPWRSTGSLGYTDSDPGTYYYRARACIGTSSAAINDSNCSDFSAPVAYLQINPPANFDVVSTTAGEAELSWDPVAEATGYRVHWQWANQTSSRTNGDKTDGFTLDSATNRYTGTLTLPNGEGGGTYLFTLYATAYGSSSDPITDTAEVAVPTPTGFSVSNEGIPAGSLRLQWDQREGYTYKLYWTNYSEARPGDTSTDEIDDVTSPKTIDNLLGGRPYFYFLTASGYGAESAPETPQYYYEVPEIPSPSNFTAVPASSTSVRLSWAAAAGRVTGYLVEWYEGESNRIGFDELGENETSTVIGGLTPGTTYDFALVGLGYESRRGNPPLTATATPDALAPLVGLTAIPGERRVTLQWAPVYSAQGYRVYWSRTENFALNGSDVSSDLTLPAEALTKVVKDLPYGVPYHFAVVAYRGTDETSDARISAASSIRFNAWLGPNNSLVEFASGLTGRYQFYRWRDPDCTISTYFSSCVGESAFDDLDANSYDFTDDVLTLTQDAIYTVVDDQSVDVSRYITRNQLPPRAFHQVVTFNDRLYLIGGLFEGSTRLNDVWSTTDGVNWRQELANDPQATDRFSPRRRHQAVVFNDRLYVIGGEFRPMNSFISERVNDVWSSANGIDWTQDLATDATATNRFSPRYGHQVVVFNNKLYLIGGHEGGTSYNDVWSSTNGIDWTEDTLGVTSTRFSKRRDHQLVVFDDGRGERLWLIGGYDGNRKNDVWSSANGIDWSNDLANDGNATDRFSPRAGHQIVTFNGKLYLIGGRQSGSTYYNDVWSSTNGVDWVQVLGNHADAEDRFSPRQSHQLTVFNDQLILTAGAPNNSTRFDDTWTSSNGITWLNPAAGSTLFSGRSGVATAVLNDRIFLTGGLKNEVLSSADGLDWFRNTHAADFPPRAGPSLVTFNNELYLIGGYDGRYFPVTDVVWKSDNGADWNKVRETTDPDESPFDLAYKAAVLSSTRGERIYLVTSGASEVWSSADGADWTQDAVDPVSPVRQYSSFGLVSFNNRLYLIGGLNSETVGTAPGCSSTLGGTALNDVWSSADGITWRQDLTADFSPGTSRFSPRGNHAAVVFDGKIYVIGGEKGCSQDGVWGINKYKDVWSTRDGVNWTQVIADAPFPVNIAVVNTRAINNGSNKGIYMIFESGSVWRSLNGSDWRFGLRAELLFDN